MRPAGTVGGDERWLRSTVPAPAVTSSGAPPDQSTAVPSTADPSTAEAATEPALPRRSLDDSDLGWGDRADDSNDERLQQNRPPHW
ncbi:hypothetical protein CELL_02160 [Cellulomonas sp. T2.31MG-18]